MSDISHYNDQASEIQKPEVLRHNFQKKLYMLGSVAGSSVQCLNQELGKYYNSSDDNFFQSEKYVDEDIEEGTRSFDWSLSYDGEYVELNNDP